jgi:hypothetical protein
MFREARAMQVVVIGILLGAGIAFLSDLLH